MTHHFSKAFLLSALILGTFTAFYLAFFVNRIGPNTYFGDLNISAKNKVAAKRILLNYLNNYQEQKISFIFANQKFDIAFDEFGVKLNTEQSIAQVFEKTGSNSLTYGFKKKLTSLLVREKISPIYEIDFEKLSGTLDSMLAVYEKPSSDATVAVLNKEIILKSAKRGVVVDRSKLYADIAKRLTSLESSNIELAYIEQKPVVEDAQAQKALERARQINKQNITLKHGHETWTLSSEVLLSLLSFSVQGFSGEDYAKLQISQTPVLIKNIYYSDKEEPILEVRLNNDKIDSFIADISKTLDRPTVDASLEFEGGRVTKFTSAQNGQKLDRQLAKNLILNVLSIDNLNADKNITIDLPVNVEKAKIANEEVNSLGIRELIASGVSYFAGSIPNRISNIELGAKLINGVIVAPGEIYSFDKLVGPVSAEQGFKQAYVISKGRTVLDDGGGICQVSTTVFRAALNAGLPILERTAHAYRVSYYEQRGFKPGFDATIWSPSVDLKFKNDTDNHILVQTAVDRAQAKLQVDIYGTADNRRVEISDPALSNQRPAPEPLYQDEPTLPKGTTKQVDFAAAGLTSVFTRKVYRDGNLIIDDTFKSNFRPWQAVYLVGTGG